MTEYRVQTRALAVGYDGKPLIRDISIGIRPGEIVSLIGPNGAGKSTILKSLSRQLRALAGTVILGRDELSRLSQRELAGRMARRRPEGGPAQGQNLILSILAPVRGPESSRRRAVSTMASRGMVFLQNQCE